MSIYGHNTSYVCVLPTYVPVTIGYQSLVDCFLMMTLAKIFQHGQIKIHFINVTVLIKLLAKYLQNHQNFYLNLSITITGKK